jgi:predicted transcriptional regulator
MNTKKAVYFTEESKKVIGDVPSGLFSKRVNDLIAQAGRLQREKEIEQDYNQYFTSLEKPFSDTRVNLVDIMSKDAFFQDEDEEEGWFKA